MTPSGPAPILCYSPSLTLCAAFPLMQESNRASAAAISLLHCGIRSTTASKSRRLLSLVGPVSVVCSRTHPRKLHLPFLHHSRRLACTIGCVFVHCSVRAVQERRSHPTAAGQLSAGAQRRMNLFEEGIARKMRIPVQRAAERFRDSRMQRESLSRRKPGICPTSANQNAWLKGTGLICFQNSRKISVF